jgi:cation diffusion facilitator CzcD-associated flavoprotein CzcO
MSSSVSYDRSHHLVIGAGVLGVIAGYAYSKAGIPVVLFEREGDVGGVWNKNLQCARVNSESRAQYEPAFFRTLGDYSPIEEREGEFGGIWSTPERVVEQTRAMREAQQLKICFNRLVLTWAHAKDSEVGEVDVTWKDLVSGQVKTERFAGLHIRTGFQHNPRPISFENEAAFTGVRGLGMKDDIPLSAFKGKQVVVLGGASSAVDNAYRALVGGASRYCTDASLECCTQLMLLTCWWE